MITSAFSEGLVAFAGASGSSEGWAGRIVEVEILQTFPGSRQLRMQTQSGLTLIRPTEFQGEVRTKAATGSALLSVKRNEILVAGSGARLELGPSTSWLLVRIDPILLQEFQGLGGWPGELLEDSAIVMQAPGLLRLMDQLINEQQNGAFASEFALHSLARLAIVEILRRSRIDQRSDPWVALPPRQLRTILTYIDANLSRTISLRELASLHGWSPHYFCRIFKQATGLSPHQYILHRRIERAKELLSDHRRNLAGIALESGFGSQSHFGTIFRRLTGCTPKKFRQLAAA